MRLSRYDLMIVGKYFQNNMDYINLMKVSKKFKNIVKMYHFNPIDIDFNNNLFKNIQSFYIHLDFLNKYATSIKNENDIILIANNLLKFNKINIAIKYPKNYDIIINDCVKMNYYEYDFDHPYVYLSNQLTNCLFSHAWSLMHLILNSDKPCTITIVDAPRLKTIDANGNIDIHLHKINLEYLRVNMLENSIKNNKIKLDSCNIHERIIYNSNSIETKNTKINIGIIKNMDNVILNNNIKDFKIYGNINTLTINNSTNNYYYFDANIVQLKIVTTMDNLKIKTNHINSLNTDKLNITHLIIDSDIDYLISTFNNCKNLKDITITGNVHTINNAFNNCNKLENIEIEGNVNTIYSNSFINCNPVIKIYKYVKYLKTINYNNIPIYIKDTTIKPILI